MRSLQIFPLCVLCVGLAACSSTPTREMTADEVSFYGAQKDFEYPVTRKVPPMYPVSAAKNQISGQVVLSYKIDGSGETTDIQVMESTPAGVFDKSAKRAIASWQYKEIVKEDMQLERSNRKARFVFSTPCDKSGAKQADDIPTISICGYRRPKSSAR